MVDLCTISPQDGGGMYPSPGADAITYCGGSYAHEQIIHSLYEEQQKHSHVVVVFVAQKPYKSKRRA